MRYALLFLLTFCACAPHAKLSKPVLQFPIGEKIHLPFTPSSDWQKSKFYYSGDVAYTDSSVILHRGGYLTGITWHGNFPRDHYKIELDARRIEGMDFFCGLTFPVAEQPCSLILGGWGGYTTGLSSINGEDAANNQTMNSFIFANNVWYHVQLLVQPEKIIGWVNDFTLFELDRADKNFSIRYEVQESVPLGVATFNTTGEIRNFTIQKLD